MRKSFALFRRRKKKNSRREDESKIIDEEKPALRVESATPNQDPEPRKMEPSTDDSLLGATVAGSSVNTAPSVTLKPPEPDRSIPEVKDTDGAPQLIQAYDAIPILEQTHLPRGGVSVETQAVGRVQVRSGITSLFLVVLTFSFSSESLPKPSRTA